MESRASERAALIGTIDPATVANTEVFTDVIDMSLWREVLGIAMLGNMANETIDFKCYYCDSDGSNAVALLSATQLAASATANDNTQVIISVKAEDVLATTSPTTQNRRYIKFGLVTGGATGGPACVAALGFKATYGPASDNDLSTVQQIKTN